MVAVRILMSLCVLVLFNAVPASATSTPGTLTYQGRIIKPDTTPLEAAAVTFTVQVRSPDANNCLLYEDTQVGVNMTGSNGIFSLELGAPGNRTDGQPYTFRQVFDNTFDFPAALTCDVSNDYVPSATDGRNLVITFNDGAGAVTLSPAHEIRSVPFALMADVAQSAKAVGSIQASNVASLRDDVTHDLNQSNLEAIFTTANYTELLALLAGTSSSFVNATPTSAVDFNSQRLTSVADPTSAQDAATKNYSDSNIGGTSANITGVSGAAGDGKVLSWNQGAGEWQAVDLPATDVSNTPSGDIAATDVQAAINELDSEKLALAGGTMSGDIDMNGNNTVNSGYITMNADTYLHLGRYDDTAEAALVGTPLTAAHEGVMWYDEEDNILEYWDGGSVQTVGNGAAPATTADADDDTKIQVEESTDEDTIRFDTAGAERMVIDNVGNVGIGMANPLEKLHLNGSVWAEAENSFIGVDATAVTRMGLVKKSGTEPVIAAGNTINLRLGHWSTSDLRGNIGSGTFTEQLIIQPGGNVGIGTTSPGAELEVSPSGVTNGGVLLGTGFEGSGAVNPRGGIGFRRETGSAISGRIYGDGTAGWLHLHYDTRNDHRFFSDGTELFRISATGNVGVGTTAPVSKLHVSAGELTLNGTGAYLNYQPNNVECANNEVLKWDATNDWWICGTDNAGGGAGTLDASYDVGGAGAGRAITVDTGAVQLTGSNAADETLEVTNSGNGGVALFENTGTGNSFRVNDEASDTTPFVIDAAGNVGVGTTTPSVPLTLVGSLGQRQVQLSDGTGGELITLGYDASDSDPQGSPRLRLQRHSDNFDTSEIELGSSSNTMMKLYLPASSDGQDSGDAVLEYRAANSFSIDAGPNNPVVMVTSAENVGIGTTTPADRLVVKGGDFVVLDGTDTERFRVDTNGTGGYVSHFPDRLRVDDRLLLNDSDTYIHNPGGGAIATVHNGSERVRITNAGDVGIGITTPGSKLHVSAGEFTLDGVGAYLDYKPNNVKCGNNEVLKWIDANDRWECGTDNAGAGAQTLDGTYDQGGNTVAVDAQDVIWNLTSTQDFYVRDNGAAALTVLDDGNVGIKTSSPTEALELNGVLELAGGETADEARIHFAASDTSNRFVVETDLDASVANDLLGFRSVSSDNILVLKGDGKVGVGTAAPVTALTVKGQISLLNPTNSQRALIGIPAWDGSYLSIQNGTLADTAANAALMQNPAGATQVNAAGGQDLDLRISNSTILRVSSTGRVGISETAPEEKLHVRGNAIFGAQTSTAGQHSMTLRADNAGAGAELFTIGFERSNYNPGENAAEIVFGREGGGAEANIRFKTQTGASSLTEKMRIEHNGNVGIGETSPSFPLHVFRSSTGTVAEFEADGNAVVSINRSNATQPGNAELVVSNLGRLAVLADDWITFGPANTEAVRIISSGNVGIGTTAPGSKLHVSAGELTLDGVGAYLDYKPNNTECANNEVLKWDDTNDRWICGTDNAGAGAQTMDETYDQGTNTVAVDAQDMIWNLTSTQDFKIQDAGTDFFVANDSGQIGIGTASMDEALHLKGRMVFEEPGGGSKKWVAFSPSSSNDFVIAEDTAAGSQRFVIEAGGNVGIGTASPTHKLTIGGGPIAMDNNTGLVMKTSSGAARLFFNVDGSDQLRIGNTGAGDGNDSISFQVTGIADALTIDSSGEVGVGVAAPSSILDVDGALTVQEMAAPAVSATGDGRIYFDSTSKTFKVSENGGAYVDLVPSGGGLFNVVEDTSPQLGGFLDANGNNIQMGSAYINNDGGSEGLSFDTAGRATITNLNGSVSDGLSIRNSSAASGSGSGLAFKNSSVTGGRIHSLVDGTTAEVGLVFSTRTSNTLGERMRIDAAGNVGIGTIPGVKLHVSSNDGANTGYYVVSSQAITNNAGGTEFTRIYMGQNADNVGFIEIADETNTKGSLLLQPWGGNIGIGLTTASTAFEVGAVGSDADAGYITLNRTNNDANKKKWVFRSSGGTSTGNLIISAANDSHTEGATSIANDVMYLGRDGAVGLGTTGPDASAIVDITSTSKGFLPPRMTTAQRTGISSPAEGLIVYDTDLDKLYIVENSSWAEVGGDTTIGGYEIVTNSVAAGAGAGWYSAVCPAGKQVLGGSCQNSNGAIAANTNVIDPTTFRCYKHNTTNAWTIKAVCGYATTSAAIAVIGDSDDDTKIHTEESADEDIIRFDTAGTERMIIDGSGNVTIGANGLLDIGFQAVTQSCAGGASTCTATCPAGKYAISGGCHSNNPSTTIQKFNMVGNNQWFCQRNGTGGTTFQAIVYCGRIKH